MKIKWFAVLMVCAYGSYAQTSVEKTIPVKPGQNVVINLEDPAITLQTWDKNEILIKGTVSINRGEHDSAYELQSESTTTEIRITGVLKDKDNIPKRIIIKKGDMEYYFKTDNFNDPSIQKFKEENGGEYAYMSNGIIKDIRLQIFIPKKLNTQVTAKFGLVEVKNFDGPLFVDSKFGGVDATLAAASTGELTARTRFGEILTNLDIKFDQTSYRGSNDSWTEIHAKLGSGPSLSVESKFGNVYLRKGN